MNENNMTHETLRWTDCVHTHGHTRTHTHTHRHTHTQYPTPQTGMFSQIQPTPVVSLCTSPQLSSGITKYSHARS